jgi:hypothetical protein
MIVVQGIIAAWIAECPSSEPKERCQHSRTEDDAESQSNRSQFHLFNKSQLTCTATEADDRRSTSEQHLKAEFGEQQRDSDHSASNSPKPARDFHFFEP